MTYRSILSATLLILATMPFAMADVNLVVPKNTEILTVNGKAFKADSDLRLADGINQVVFRYVGQYRQKADAVTYLSEALIIRFNESNQTLTLKLPVINSATAAKQFDNAPNIALTNDQGMAVDFTHDKLLKNGLQIGRDFEHEMLQYNLGGGAASLNITMTRQTVTPNNADSAANKSASSTQLIAASTVATSAAVTQPPQAATADSPTQAEISQMLDYWYQLANDETKASFKAKIK